MTQHTPGPWHVGCTEHYETEIIDSNNSIVARANAYPTDTHMLGCGTEHPMANARLIAAAPDLLASCRELVAAMHQCGKGHHREVLAAEAAIAKATATDA